MRIANTIQDVKTLGRIRDINEMIGTLEAERDQLILSLNLKRPPSPNQQVIVELAKFGKLRTMTLREVAAAIGSNHAQGAKYHIKQLIKEGHLSSDLVNPKWNIYEEKTND